MDWLSGSASVAAHVASGGLFGMLGSVLGVGARWLQERSRRKFQVQVWSHELKLQELQIRAAAEETEQEIELARVKGSWDGLKASHRASAREVDGVNLHPVIVSIKTLWRPFLTLCLGVAVMLLWKDLIGLAQNGDSDLRALLSQQEAAELASYIIRSVVFSSSTAFVWWFGDRALNPPGSKHK